MHRRQNSGQVILIAVLAMALILFSAQVYVFDVNMSSFSLSSDFPSDYIASVKQGSRNVVAGSLANISNGGASFILTENLDRWATLVSKQSQFGKSTLTYVKEELSQYSSGVWLSWSTEGYGISSSTVHFAFNLFDSEVEADLSYEANVTTGLSIESAYRIIGIGQEQINITINLSNDGSPALASQIKVYYKELGMWLEPNEPNNYVLTDYGNGTYLASFDAFILLPPIETSVHTVDSRGIYVQANGTCTLV